MTNVLDRAKQFSDGVAIITEWLGSGARIVAKELAQKRANICIECPMNQAESFLSETIASAIKRQVEIKSKLELRVDGEKKLHTCSACGCSTPLKIWLPIENIMPDSGERKNFQQNHCWCLKESEQYEKEQSNPPES